MDYFSFEPEELHNVFFSSDQPPPLHQSGNETFSSLQQLPPPVIVQSSFVPYATCLSQPVIKRRNIHMRMIEFLRQIPISTANSTDKIGGYTISDHELREFHSDRSYKHMINERLRRNKQKQTYTSLHSLLPPGTKIDKNSILQAATMHMRELIGLKQELHERNHHLEAQLCSRREARKPETAKIALRRQTMSSGFDSMIGALACLRKMGAQPIAIQANFSTGEFVATLEIQPEIEEMVVEMAVQRALDEVDNKFVYNGFNGGR